MNEEFFFSPEDEWMNAVGLLLCCNLAKLDLYIVPWLLFVVLSFLNRYIIYGILISFIYSLGCVCVCGKVP